MIDISIKELKKAYDDGINILDGLSFDVQAGEHIGILGRNGCGKTTLFRILSGEIHYDDGDVFLANGKRMGLISQIPVYPAHYTTEDVLKTAHERVYAIGRRLDELTRLMEKDASDDVMREYDRLSADFERLGGYDTEFERSRVANGLDIPPAMRERLFSQLSGGEKTRVNLARLILEDTDILLLDEPTNHLDLHATEWLENYVNHFQGTVLAISHDRWFLDTVAQRCIEIVDGKAEFYSGNYSFFVEEKQRRFDEMMKKYEKDQAKIKQLTKAAEQMHLWAFMGMDKLHKRAFSMEKRIEKLQSSPKPKTAKKLNAKFTSKEFYGDEVLLIDGISKSFGEKKLFSDLELLIEGKERIALIGDNGTGKSTFIKLIMGEEWADSGYIRKGPTVKTAYLPQIIHFDYPERTLYDTMIYDCGCSPQEARDRLGHFLFSGEDVFKTVGTLSGGEQSRLRLCMLMRGDINFLILDEPTNHLDIASREWIESAILDYEEALLFVSHDRWFIEKFATRIWELRDGKITDYRGSFSEFREFKARQQSIQQAAARKEPAKKEAAPKKKNSQNTEKRIARIEKDIAKLEAEIAEKDALCEEYASDYQKLMEIGAEKEALEAQLEELFEIWEELST